eukprot:6184930-Pleurochrysis_carterae.AAC.5
MSKGHSTNCICNQSAAVSGVQAECESSFYIASTARGYSAVSCECFKHTLDSSPYSLLKHSRFTWRVRAKLTLYGIYLERSSGDCVQEMI